MLVPRNVNVNLRFIYEIMQQIKFPLGGNTTNNIGNMNFDNAFLSRDEKERLPEWEEIAAVSMAVQNMWLTCYVNNIGSYWSTPGFIHEYGKLIKLNNNESSLGFFFMGVYEHKESPKLRDDINSKVDWE